jgi:hypothetical protein
LPGSRCASRRPPFRVPPRPSRCSSATAVSQSMCTAKRRSSPPNTLAHAPLPERGTSDGNGRMKPDVMHHTINRFVIFVFLTSQFLYTHPIQILENMV